MASACRSTSTASEPDNEPKKKRLKPAQAERLSDDSTEGRLSRTEEAEAFMGSLLDTYFGSVTAEQPVVRLASLRARFERAGRRPRQLDPMTEVSASSMTLPMG